jgi:hypothetical protein
MIQSLVRKDAVATSWANIHVRTYLAPLLDENAGNNNAHDQERSPDA